MLLKYTEYVEIMTRDRLVECQQVSKPMVILIIFWVLCVERCFYDYVVSHYPNNDCMHPLEYEGFKLLTAIDTFPIFTAVPLQEPIMPLKFLL